MISQRVYGGRRLQFSQRVGCDGQSADARVMAHDRYIVGGKLDIALHHLVAVRIIGHDI